MSSINRPRTPASSTPSASTPPGATSPSGAPGAPPVSGSSATNAAPQDKYAASQSGSQFQQTVNQEILPNNSGSTTGSAHGKAKGANGKIDLDDPTLSSSTSVPK